MIVQLVLHWIDSKTCQIERIERVMFNNAPELEEFYATIPNTGVHVYPVNRSRASAPPADFRPEFPDLEWCPYCAAERSFVHSPILDLRQCEVCGVSESDWYYKNFNGLIPSARKGESNDHSRRVRQFRKDDTGSETDGGPVLGDEASAGAE